MEGGGRRGEDISTTSPFQRLKKMTKLSVGTQNACIHCGAWTLSFSLSLPLSVCLSKIFLDLFHHSFSCCCSELAAIFQAFRVPQLHLCCINYCFTPKNILYLPCLLKICCLHHVSQNPENKIKKSNIFLIVALNYLQKND